MSKTSQNLTVLLTDIKGFTEKTSRKTRADILIMLERHKELVLPVLQEKGGRLVKTIGDAFLMVFDSPTDAVLSGIAVQESLAKFNADKEGDDRIDVRIAINTGEVTLVDGDIFGDPVNITARIEAIAEAGEVFFTEAVYLAMNKREVPSSEVGLLQLKGIPEKIRVYKVVAEEPVEELPSPKMPAPPGRKGVMGWLKSKSPKKASPVSPPAPPEGIKASKARRFGAILIDVILVSMLAGIFAGKEKTGIHVTHTSGPSAEEEMENAEAQEQSEKAVNLLIRIDESGVRIGDRAVIEREEESETIYTDGNLKVRTTKKKKDAAFPIFWVVYCTFFLLYWGATPGKRICKLQVIQTNGLKLEWRHALVRSIFTLISGSVVMLGFIWAFFQADGRGWHDLIAGTVVTSAEPSKTVR